MNRSSDDARAVRPRLTLTSALLVSLLAGCGGGADPSSSSTNNGTNTSTSSQAVALSFYSSANLQAWIDTQGSYSNVAHARLAVFGGTPTTSGYTWSYTLGSGLPSTITVDPKTGVLQGTITNATNPGIYDLTVKVTDGTHSITSAAGFYRVFVNVCNSGSGGVNAYSCGGSIGSTPYPQGPPSLNGFTYTASVPESLTWDMSVTGIHAGAPFGYTLPLSGGTPPYAFAIASGSLPPGLTLDSSTGTILGTPTTAGIGNTYGFSVRVTDGVGNQGMGYYSLGSITN